MKRFIVVLEMLSHSPFERLTDPVDKAYIAQIETEGCGTMQSSLIGKIEKARRYANEPTRVSIQHLSATFRGDNDEHQISIEDGVMRCECEFFTARGVCCHTMAMERMLSNVLPRSTTNKSEALHGMTPLPV